MPADKIDGMAKVDGHSIEGTWSRKKGKSPTKVTESENYTVVFTPRYTEYYYAAETDINVTVVPRAITSDIIKIALSRNSFIYDGTAQKPTVAVKMNDTDLVENIDYTVTYPTNMTDAGTKEIKINGIGNFTVKDSTNNNAAVTKAAASADNKSYV